MRIIHRFGKKKSFAKKIADEPGFLISNQNGGYLWLNDYPTSRYQGWFFSSPKYIGKKIFKVIENIEIKGAEKVDSLENNFANIKRKRADIEETFFLPCFLDCLIYQTNKKVNLEIFLDIKESFDNSEWNRIYEISEKKDVYIIKFFQKERDLPPVFLAIKPFGGKAVKKESWTKRDYSLDKQRQSFPWERYVFCALNIENCDKVIFSAAFDEKEAIDNLYYVCKNTPSLIKQKQKGLEKIKFRKNINDKQAAFADFCAKNSLLSLLMRKNGLGTKKGVYAGLPWFSQFWPRDEAVSLKGLSLIQKKDAEKILFDMLGGKNPLFSTDSITWMLKRFLDFNQKNDKIFKKIFSQKRFEINTKNGFFLSESSTWMDTLQRSPSPLELQATGLILNKLQCLADKKGRQEYLKKERELKEKIKSAFWDGSLLADGFNPYNLSLDKTIRPNIFLAHYLYPKLLEKKEWELCFENALKNLFLAWGGLASVDKKHPSFQGNHSGQESSSYHQGDSWFFINNLAALALFRVNKSKFREYIKKIISASTEDILWKGAIGHHSEISSANELSPCGCVAQAWSAAAYIELISEIFQS